MALLKCGISPIIFGGWGHLSQFSWRDTAPFHLPNGMKDMAATWCKGKVNNAGYL